MGKQSQYTPEVRERAVRLYEEQRPHHASDWAAFTSIAEKIGCTAETLRKWHKAANPTRQESEHKDAVARLKELERENKELRKSNEILRKAAAFFAQAELWPSPQSRTTAYERVG